MSQKLVHSAAGFLERRTSRRGFLGRAAVAGAALVAGPVRYLVRPDSAWAVVGCSQCSSSSKCCTDGYTEFCAATNSGSNTCPSYGYFGGYWRCSPYNGSSLCCNTDVRYYIDCNVRPGDTCVGGCHCGASDCNCRHTCCKVFRYGNCNTQIVGTTAVICRVIHCQRPDLLGYRCSSSYQTDVNTCGHESCKHNLPC